MAQDWAVISQRQTTSLNPAGTGFEDVIEVTFRVVSGPAADHVGTVRVPVSRYSPGVVSGMVQPMVDQLQAVAALGS